MTKSNADKATEIADAACAWAKDVEEQGDTVRYLRGGMLNKSLIAQTLGFSRSLWQSNTRLKELAERLDGDWGTALTKSDIRARMDEFLATLDAQGDLPPNDGKALLLDATLVKAGIAPAQYQHYREVRDRLAELADQHGLTLGTPGAVEETEADTGNVASDMVPVARLREAQMRLSQAERKNADLKAENASLRAQMQRNDEVAELIATGGRIAPK
jgi:hypothetical protein